MKKFTATQRSATAIVALFFCLSMATCGGGNADEGPDTATYTPRSDSIATLLGKVQGARFLHEIEHYRAQRDSTFSADEFLNGMATVFDRRHPLAYVFGLSLGVQVNQDIDPLTQAGLPIDRKRLVDMIEQNINTEDSIHADTSYDVSQQYMALATRAMNASSSEGSKALADSIESLYADMISAKVSQDLYNFQNNEGRQYDLPAFLRGFRTVALSDHPEAYYAGVYNGAMLAQQIAVVEKKGVNVRPETLLASMKEYMTAGNVDDAQLRIDSETLNAIISEVNNAHFDREDAQMAATDEAIQNIKTGEALMTRIANETPGIVKTESGLMYVIRYQGDGEPVGDAKTVSLAYTGKHLDGKVFESKDKATMIINRVVPGLQEGLRMLREGDKATFWIPGSLGYRGHGMPRLDIGPMETIVFDIEILPANP